MLDVDGVIYYQGAVKAHVVISQPPPDGVIGIWPIFFVSTSCGNNPYCLESNAWCKAARRRFLRRYAGRR